jgi:hypothetical protein
MRTRYPLLVDPFIQIGGKLTGGGAAGSSQFGSSVALERRQHRPRGRACRRRSRAAWVFSRSGNT